MDIKYFLVKFYLNGFYVDSQDCAIDMTQLTHITLPEKWPAQRRLKTLEPSWQFS